MVDGSLIRQVLGIHVALNLSYCANLQQLSNVNYSYWGCDESYEITAAGKVA